MSDDQEAIVDPKENDTRMGVRDSSSNSNSSNVAGLHAVASLQQQSSPPFGKSETRDDDDKKSSHSVDAKEGKESKYTYRDFSRVKPDASYLSMGGMGGAASTTIRVQKLPAKLNAMLSNPGYAHIVSWMPHGRSWKVHNPHAFVEEVIPQFFEYANYNSFIRLVNAWGFRRLTKGADRNSYYHELFLRGTPHLHARMHRLKPGEKKAPLEPDEEPDLAKLSELYPLPEETPMMLLSRPPPPAQQLSGRLGLGGLDLRSIALLNHQQAAAAAAASPFAGGTTGQLGARFSGSSGLVGDRHLGTSTTATGAAALGCSGAMGSATALGAAATALGHGSLGLPPPSLGPSSRALLGQFDTTRLGQQLEPTTRRAAAAAAAAYEDQGQESIAMSLARLQGHYLGSPQLHGQQQQQQLHQTQQQQLQQQQQQQLQQLQQQQQSRVKQAYEMQTLQLLREEEQARLNRMMSSSSSNTSGQVNAAATDQARLLAGQRLSADAQYLSARSAAPRDSLSNLWAGQSSSQSVAPEFADAEEQIRGVLPQAFPSPAHSKR